MVVLPLLWLLPYGDEEIAEGCDRGGLFEYFIITPSDHLRDQNHDPLPLR